MKIDEGQKLFEKSEKKSIGGVNTLFIIVLNHAFFLPILLILGIELQTQINEFNFDLFYETFSFYYVISALVILFFFLTIFYYQRFYLKKQILKHDLNCFFCEKRAIVELYKIPNFFINFGIPICEQHVKVLDENINNLLYKEQKLYKKYKLITIWLNIFIIAFEIISLICFGFLFGLFGNVSLIILTYILFTLQIFLYFFLYMKMFLKIRNGINKL